VLPPSASPAPVSSASIVVPATPLPSSSVAVHVIVCGVPAGFVSVSGSQFRFDAVHVLVIVSVSSSEPAASSPAWVSAVSPSLTLSSLASSSIHARYEVVPACGLESSNEHEPSSSLGVVGSSSVVQV
jgi:hypothetical protein